MSGENGQSHLVHQASFIPLRQHKLPLPWGVTGGRHHGGQQPMVPHREIPPWWDPEGMLSCTLGSEMSEA